MSVCVLLHNIKRVYWNALTASSPSIFYLYFLSCCVEMTMLESRCLYGYPHRQGVGISGTYWETEPLSPDVEGFYILTATAKYAPLPQRGHLCPIQQAPLVSRFHTAPGKPLLQPLPVLVGLTHESAGPGGDEQLSRPPPPTLLFPLNSATLQDSEAQLICSPHGWRTLRSGVSWVFWYTWPMRAPGIVLRFSTLLQIWIIFPRPGHSQVALFTLRTYLICAPKPSCALLQASGELPFWSPDRGLWEIWLRLTWWQPFMF